MRMAMARPVMRLGPVHVVVVVPSTALRDALVQWLRRDGRVRIVRAAASAAELGQHELDCDLVLASALAGTRELRVLARRFAERAGLVALSLGEAPLPPPWTAIRPGASQRVVLERARAHPERTVARTSTVLASIAVAFLAVILSVLYVPADGVSYQRAALAYAARFPDVGTWWHVFGLGGPYLTSAAWPLLKAAAALGGGPEAFIPLAGVTVAAFAVSFLLLAIRLGSTRGGFAVALATVALPAIWLWPRTGDVSSLTGAAGVAVALATSRSTRMRLLAAAAGPAISSFGGILWVLASAVVAIVAGVRGRRVRSSVSGAILGTVATAAVTAPPLLERGWAGLRPVLARPPALSDLAPMVAAAAALGVFVAWQRQRRALAAAAAALLLGANVLAMLVPVERISVWSVPSTGAMGRLAVHPDVALQYATLEPDLPTTGMDVSADLILGARPRAETNGRLEAFGADRAVLPDRSAAIVFNERDWSLLDRDRLLFSAPSVRPILTSGITATMLVVADDQDASVFGDALVALGTTTEQVIAVRAGRTLDELDRDTLRSFTMLVVYGQPWKDVGKAEAVLDDYLQLSGFVYMDAAGRAGRTPLVQQARTVNATAADTRAIGDTSLLAANGFDGRVVGIEPFSFHSDPDWEKSALAVGNERVLTYGTRKIAGDAGVAAHMVWSGVDLPARAAAGDTKAIGQLRSALEWMLTDAGISVTGSYGRPAGGNVLDSELATSTFLSPTHWRIQMKVASTGVLFKERYDDHWVAYQVDRTGAQETRTPLKGLRATTQDEMYVTLPPNARIVDFVFERHPLEAAARGASGVALFIIAGVSIILARRR